MHNFLSFLTSFFLIFNPHPLVTPAPTVAWGGVGFHPYPPSNISVNWGAPAPDYTIFIVSNLLPGDQTNRSITVSNTGVSPRPLTVRGTKTSELRFFSQILNLTIYKDNVPVYGPKRLSQFFTDSLSPAGISLGNLPGHAASTYKFLVTFPSTAGNQYQEAKVVFNLKLGKLLDIPGGCRRFHDDWGDFTVDSGHRRVFISFDCEDKIDDRNPNRCTPVISR